jgi:hypothetical protein
MLEVKIKCSTKTSQSCKTSRGKTTIFMFSCLCDVLEGASAPFFCDVLLLMTYFADSSAHAVAGNVGSNPVGDTDVFLL